MDGTGSEEIRRIVGAVGGPLLVGVTVGEGLAVSRRIPGRSGSGPTRMSGWKAEKHDWGNASTRSRLSFRLKAVADRGMGGGNPAPQHAPFNIAPCRVVGNARRYSSNLAGTALRPPLNVCSPSRAGNDCGKRSFRVTYRSASERRVSDLVPSPPRWRSLSGWFKRERPIILTSPQHSQATAHRHDRLHRHRTTDPICFRPTRGGRRWRRRHPPTLTA